MRSCIAEVPEVDDIAGLRDETRQRGWSAEAFGRSPLTIYFLHLQYASFAILTTYTDMHFLSLTRVWRECP